MDLAVGVLSWRAFGTLENTLASYKRHGLLDLAEEHLCYIQQTEPRAETIFAKYGFRPHGSAENVGIAKGLLHLLDRTRSEFFLFLEDDWELVVAAETLALRLGAAATLLRQGNVNCVKLRHRQNPGDPLFSRRFVQGRELQHATHLLESVHWMDEPSAVFPSLIGKRIVDGETFYVADSVNANYTNNPCLYLTAFAKENIAPVARQASWNLEPEMDKLWPTRGYRIAQGEGLFTHKRIDR
jgi:hypothetical protein